MFNRKSIYALNKKDPDAIVYMDANEVIICLTREDFASEEEFLKWKSWSDGNYHTEDNQDVVEGKHNTSIDDLSEAALSIPAIDVVMDRQHEKSERRRMASTMVSQIRDKLTETQFRRLWMYYVDGMTVDEIGEKEGVSRQAAYIRLSYTDDHSSESDSVSNQRKLIENFVERNPDIEVVSEKIDDGYSGIIFDRPAFKEMMQDVTDGNINCVIVKDYCAIIGLNQKDLENQGILA